MRADSADRIDLEIGGSHPQNPDMAQKTPAATDPLSLQAERRIFLLR
jgi:hypothetical protein